MLKIYQGAYIESKSRFHAWSLGKTLSNRGLVHGHNSVMNPRSHAQSLGECVPLARLAGDTALHQLAQTAPECDFLQEQPDPSMLYEVDPWPRVLMHARIASRVIDQCATGQRARSGPNKGKYIRKRTRVVSSCEQAMSPFDGVRCNGRHEHVQATGIVAAEARLWTWHFASLVVDFCRLCIRHRDRAPCRGSPTEATYPGVSAASSVQPRADDLPEEQWRKFTAMGSGAQLATLTALGAVVTYFRAHLGCGCSIAAY